MRDDLVSYDAKAVLVVRLEEVAEVVLERVPEKVDAGAGVRVMTVVCKGMFGGDLFSGKGIPLFDLHEARWWDVVCGTSWGEVHAGTYLMCVAMENVKCLMCS